MPSESTVRRIVEYASGLEGINPQILQEGLEIACLHRRVEQVMENDLAGGD